MKKYNTILLTLTILFITLNACTTDSTFIGKWKQINSDSEISIVKNGNSFVLTAINGYSWGMELTRIEDQLQGHDKHGIIYVVTYNRQNNQLTLKDCTPNFFVMRPQADKNYIKISN